ncbi:hypothetical protein [Nocardioides sp.]|uniref:hypothetical protein n=1 Tax=Nocardioides sp. TaxID=35761 RepID=UPI00378333AB
MTGPSTGDDPRRVFLHVGSPKTGTTFLQQVLWSQRDRVEQQGVRLPLGSFDDHYLATLDLRGLARPPHPPRARGMWMRMVEEVEGWPRTSLVSHELFAAADRDQVRRAISSFRPDTEVHVVLTARDLLRQVSAEWQEHVKHRSTLPFDEFVAGVRTEAATRTGWFWRVQDYVGILDRWGSGLPPSQVHVVTVPPVGAPPGLLWERFAGLLGLDAGAFDTAVPRSNTSLGLEQVELLRRVNVALGDRLPMPGPYPVVVKGILAHQVLAARPGSPLRLAPEDVAFAAEESRRLADGMAEAGVDVVGSLDDLVVGDDTVRAAATGEGYQAVPEADLLEESVLALADLLVDVSETSQRTRPAIERGEALRAHPVRAALNELADQHGSLGRARQVARRVRRRR